METFYLFLIIFLFVLAVFDLSVGVSNDARSEERRVGKEC